MKRKMHYSPRISRLLVSVLYHEAQRWRVPMTKLTDALLTQALQGTPSWKVMEAARVAEEPPQPNR